MFTLIQKLCRISFLLTSGLVVTIHTAPKTNPEKSPLLEVVRASWSVERDETLLYLRVYSDGFAEADPMRQVDFRNLKLKTKQLSSDDVASLSAILSDAETIRLLREYPSSWGNKDFGYRYEITIAGSSPKQITLVNFQPFLARKEGKPYPKQLEKLGCLVWKLRAEVSGERLEKDWLKGCSQLGY